MGTPVENERFSPPSAVSRQPVQPKTALGPAADVPLPCHHATRGGHAELDR